MAQRSHCWYCTCVVVLIVLFSFQFWNGKQTFIPNVWQVVFANVSVEGRVVDSDVYGLFDGSGHILTLPFYDFEILQCCFVTSNVLTFENG